MDHPLIRSTLASNGTLCMPKMDHIDPVPDHDGNVRNAYNSPIALTYDDHYAPASYEIRRITHTLSQAQFALYYKLVPREGPCLDMAISGLVTHYNNYMKDKLSFDALIPILILESLNIWLSDNNRWFMLTPSPNTPYLESFPPFLFYLRKNDTETDAARLRARQRAPKRAKKEKADLDVEMKGESDQEQEEQEEEIKKPDETTKDSLVDVCMRVINTCLPKRDHIAKEVVVRYLKDRLVDLLLKAQFSPMCINLPSGSGDSGPALRVYDIHGLSKSNRAVFTVRVPDTADAFWCHMLFEPEEYIWPGLPTGGGGSGGVHNPRRTKQSVDADRYAYSMVACFLNEPSLTVLRKFLDRTGNAPVSIQTNLITNYTTKRSLSRSKANIANNKLIQTEELRLRAIFNNDQLFHPLQLRYSYYARNGMVYANPVRLTSASNGTVNANNYSLYDVMGITESYWIWLKKRYNATCISEYGYYYDRETQDVCNGEFLALNLPTEIRTCEIQVQKKNKPTVCWYARINTATEVSGYANVYLLTWLLFAKELATNKAKAQDVLDALFTFCETATDAYMNLIHIYPTLQLSELQSSYKETRKQRILAIKLHSSALDDWMQTPNELNLYRAAKQVLNSNHTVLNLEELPHQVSEDIDDLCKTLTYVKPTRYVDSIIKVEYTTKTINTEPNGGGPFITTVTPGEFNGLISYLARCRTLLYSNIIYRIVRAWTYYHPVLTKIQEERISESSVALLRQLVIGEICSPQFKLTIRRLCDKQSGGGNGSTRLLNEKDLQLLTYAHGIVSHEIPATDPVLSNITSVLNHHGVTINPYNRFDSRTVSVFLDKCKARIRCMMHERKTLDPLILLDILDQMSYHNNKTEEESNIVIFNLLSQVVDEHKKEYLPIVARFHTTHIHNTDLFISSLASRIRI